MGPPDTPPKPPGGPPKPGTPPAPGPARPVPVITAAPLAPAAPGAPRAPASGPSGVRPVGPPASSGSGLRPAPVTTPSGVRAAVPGRPSAGTTGQRAAVPGQPLRPPAAGVTVPVGVAPGIAPVTPGAPSPGSGARPAVAPPVVAPPTPMLRPAAAPPAMPASPEHLLPFASMPSAIAAVPVSGAAPRAAAAPAMAGAGGEGSALPATGAIEVITPEQAAELERHASALDGMDYFQVLQVPQTARQADIKRAFYRESRIYHPDRLFHLDDGGPKAHVNDIYKRITEAYYVLRDEAKRQKYLGDITGPDRARKLRFSEASEAEQKAEAKKAVEEEVGLNPKARGFYKTALKDLDAGNLAAAERNLKTALTFEPGNAKYREKIAEVQKAIDKERQARGDAFKIK